jgi:hypothetical protein
MGDWVKIEGSQYGECIDINEYNGSYSLVSGRESKDGDKLFLQWGFPQTKDRTAGPKAVPWKIKIGESKDEAIATLRELLKGLGVGTADDDDEIPF